MKTRSRVVLGILAALALGTAVTTVSVSWQSILEEWYLLRLDAGDPKAHTDAREELIQLRSLKALERFLAHSTEATNMKDAARIVERLGAEAMRDLAIRLRRGDDSSYATVVQMHKNGSGAPTALGCFLAGTLRHSNPWVRRYAAEELAHLGHDARVALMELEEARRDPSEDVRFWAGLALDSLESGAAR